MSPGDAPVRERRLWPWVEQPYRLWSLLEMLNSVNVDTIAGVVRRLESTKQILILQLSRFTGWQEIVPEMMDTIDLAESRMAELPFPRAIAGQIARLRDRVKNASSAKQQNEIMLNLHILMVSFLELAECLLDELGDMMFFFVDRASAKYYSSSEDIFTREVFDALPDARNDLESAGRLYALDEWTACVFRLMRAVGFALARWSTTMGLALPVPLVEADWKTILDAAEKKQKELLNVAKANRGSTWQAELESLSEKMVYFQGFKDAWRNFVSHGRATYDGHQALEILAAVKAFLRKCV